MPGWKLSVALCTIIILSGIGLIYLIFTTEPIATREGATKETAMLVDVTGVDAGSFYPTITAMGTVVAAQEIILSPRIRGEIIDRADQFTPGGILKKGETVLRIDPSDYENTLRQRQSLLEQAQAALGIEMGRQAIAEEEYALMKDELTDEKKSLVLREPQLNAAKAEVASARAAVALAELELERTTIKSPFDAQVLTRNVNIGSQVMPGDVLGRIVGLETYWIETEIPLSKLRWIAFPDSHDAQGSEAVVRNRQIWPEGVYRTGYIYKLIGELNDRTRMARVLVSVDDPLALHTDDPEKPALMIGSFVEIHIKAREIHDVVRLNRDYLRKNDTVWVMENGRLSIRNVDIIFSDAEYAYIKSGLHKDDKVVTTNISTVVDGASLRLKNAPAAETSNDTSAGGSR